MSETDDILRQLHDDGTLEKLLEIQGDNDHFTAVHAAQYLPGSDAIDHPSEAHQYLRDLEDDGYLERVEEDERGKKQAIRYRITDYDDIL